MDSGPTSSNQQTQTIATVVICTRDRAASLGRTLTSIAEAAAGETRPWDLLILDNGSSDGTQETVAGFADRLPIRSVVHEVPGLSNARNAAIGHVRGTYLIWTDDDVLVDKGWLTAWLDAFERTPEVAIFGGRAVPRFEDPAAPWFVAGQAQLVSLLAIRDTPEWQEMTTEELPFGLNYAVRTDVQSRHPYDPDLGVAPGRRIGGEESAMLRAALEDGATGRWVWDAVVYHLIPAARQTTDYILSYYGSQGYLYHHIDGLDTLPRGEKLRHLARIATLRARRLMTATHRRLRGNPHWVGAYADYARYSGRYRRVREALGPKAGRTN